MRMQFRSSVVAVTAVATVLSVSSGRAAGQTPAAAKAAKKAYTPPKTPWGDPDVSGIFTNNDESNIPFERPGEFEGKRLEDISEEELVDLRAERNQQALERAPQLGGAP